MSLLRLRKFSFATFQPLAEIAIWAILVLVPTVQISINHVRLDNWPIANGGAPLRFSRSLGISLIVVSEQQFLTIVNLNLPGTLIGAPISVPAISYIRHHSVAFPVETWVVVTLPFFCIPAWWLVGRSLDAVLSRTRPRLAFRVIGLILCCVCIAIAIGIETSPPEDKLDLRPFMPGAIFWAVAFSLLPLTWLLPRPRTEVREHI